MTRAGNKILAGVREALAVARGDIPTIAKIKVTPSCGCVFCDVGLVAGADGVHRADGHEVVCAVAVR